MYVTHFSKVNMGEGGGGEWAGVYQKLAHELNLKNHDFSNVDC